MKRGTVDHPKTKKLAKLLELPRYAAVGILESLWHFAARYCPTGDVGRYGDDELAEDLGWTGDPKALTDALVEAEWLDRNDTHRLIVHDWPEHCDDAVHMHLARATKWFADGTEPKMVRFAKAEKDRIADNFRAAKADRKRLEKATLTNASTTLTHGVHTEYTPPEPEPEPVPKPEPEPGQGGAVADAPAADTPAVGDAAGGIRRPSGLSPIEQPPENRRAEFKAACDALDAWAMSPPPVGRGYVIALHENEHKPLVRLLAELDKLPPILRDGKPVERRLLIATAAAALVAQGMDFRSMSWACGCVKGELRDMASGTAAKGKGNGKPATPVKYGRTFS